MKMSKAKLCLNMFFNDVLIILLFKHLHLSLFSDYHDDTKCYEANPKVSGSPNAAANDE